MEIRGQGIGYGYPCYIVAEIGINANGKIEEIEKSVEVIDDEEEK